MGVAMLAVATGTYLMGVDKDAPAWIAYGFAAVVTAAMPVAPWLYLRQLRSTLAGRPALNRR
jgi:dihydrodipicolinate synthase/N-acetylneuraminate lyase